MKTPRKYRFQAEFNEAETNMLRAVSKAQGRSMSDVGRKAIAMYVCRAIVHDPDTPPEVLADVKADLRALERDAFGLTRDLSEYVTSLN